MEYQHGVVAMLRCELRLRVEDRGMGTDCDVEPAVSSFYIGTGVEVQPILGA